MGLSLSLFPLHLLRKNEKEMGFWFCIWWINSNKMGLSLSSTKQRRVSFFFLTEEALLSIEGLIKGKDKKSTPSPHNSCFLPCQLYQESSNLPAKRPFKLPSSIWSKSRFIGLQRIKGLRSKTPKLQAAWTTRRDYWNTEKVLLDWSKINGEESWTGSSVHREFRAVGFRAWVF
jgi:hypothetical protein